MTKDLNEAEEVPDEVQDAQINEEEVTARENSKMSQYFESKMMIRYRGYINISILLILLDVCTVEVVVWLDQEVPQKMNTFRILKFMLAIFLVVILTLKNLRQNITMFKGMIYTAMGLQVVINIVELYLSKYTDSIEEKRRSRR